MTSFGAHATVISVTDSPTAGSDLTFEGCSGGAPSSPGLGGITGCLTSDGSSFVHLYSDETLQTGDGPTILDSESDGFKSLSIQFADPAIVFKQLSLTISRTPPAPPPPSGGITPFVVICLESGCIGGGGGGGGGGDDGDPPVSDLLTIDFGDGFSGQLGPGETGTFTITFGGSGVNAYSFSASKNWDHVAALSFIFADPTTVPEPGMIGLLGLGVAGVALRRRRPA